MRASRPAPATLALLSLLLVLAGAAPAGAWAAADLSVALTTSPNPITSITDPSATVTVTARNSGDRAATFVAIRFAPQVLEGSDVEEILELSCPPVGAFKPDPEIAPTACIWGTIEPGASVTMTIRIRVGGTSTRISSITHSVIIAEVRQTGSVPDPTPADTTATETVGISFDTTMLDLERPRGGEDGTGREGTGGEGTSGAPQVLALRLSPAAFRAARRGPSALAARAPVGTLVTTRLSAAATETFRVERATTGRRVGGRCVAATRRNRRAPRCTRWPVLSGRFSAAGTAGLNRLRFTGRLGGLPLAPGRYRLAVSAADDRGRVSAVRRAGFRIVS